MKPHEYVILEVSRERERQMSAERWTPEHDDTHSGFQMARAAAAYCLETAAEAMPHPTPEAPSHKYGVHLLASQSWPWDRKWWKPRDARRNLVRAAALIVAEIERLDRKEAARAA